MRKIITVIALLISLSVFAQKGAVKGFVYDQSNGEAISYATVKVEGTDFGAATDDDGFFNIPNLPEGKYNLVVSYIGFDNHTKEVEIKKGKTVSVKIYMTSTSIELQSVEINAQKQRQRTETRVSVTSITPMEMRRLPTVGGDADIAQYLQVLPGVVSTGDQGGEVIIRGGTPIQTKFLLDGITIYNPFHSIGLFSIYETSIVKNVDVYTGGFPAQYGGRTAAVVDVSTRDGNQKKVSGEFGINPFAVHGLLEIPVVKIKEGRNVSASLILNTKISYLDKSSKVFYPYVDKNGLPYSFYDFYGKFTLNAGKSMKMTVSGFNFRDNAAFAQANYGWNTFGVGVNFLTIPTNSNLSFNTHASYSQYAIKLTEADGLPRQSSIGGFDVGMDFVYYIKNGELKYGLDVEGTQTDFSFYNLYAAKYEQSQNSTDFDLYMMFHKYVKKFVVEAGARLQYYGNISAISPEPRLSIKYNINDYIRLKLASGMYSQNFISSKSDRDVVNLFTGFLTGPDESAVDATGKVYDGIKNMQRSADVIFGVELDLPKNITFNIEPYYKYFWHLFNINRYKLSNTDPDFLIEKGNAYGLDVTAKWEWRHLYLYATYSLSWAHRNDGAQVYPPHFDRRHNVNLLASYSFGKTHSWEVSARWNMGSGFPVYQTQSFYENVPFTDGINTNYTSANGNLGIIYPQQINGGRMPYYHRLDFSIKKTFNIRDKAKIEIGASVTNVYNRKNIFYFNRVTYERVNQLPILPSLSLSVSF